MKGPKHTGNAGHSGNANLLIGGSKNASRETGAPRKTGGPRGWHSRGYLPHFDSDVATQHVTFHLADSLPSEVVLRLEEELNAVPPEKQEVERRKRVEAWIDSGHGSCLLREPSIGRMVEDSLLFFDARRYQLLAWVVMPNHVHVLFQPKSGWSVAKIVASWKKFTARKICDYLKNATLASGSLKRANQEISGPRANQEIGIPGGNQEIAVPSVVKISPIWHREYWDRFIRDDSHFQQAMEYIHQNPVKAGLIERAEDWPWSSARFSKKWDYEH